MPLNAIQIKNLRKAYSSLTVLDLPALEFRAGQLTCVLGATGCGKTTLLNILAGTDQTFSGEVIRSGLPKPRVSYQFQKDLLLPWKTVRDNLLLGFHINNEPMPDNLVDSWLETFDLEKMGESYPAALSVGTRQRVSLGRALAWNGDLKLLDEPLSAQDFTRRLRLEALLRVELRKPGTLAIVVTHNLEEAVILADRIIVLGGQPARVLDDFEVIGLPENNRPVEGRCSPEFARYIARAARALSGITTTT